MSFTKLRNILKTGDEQTALNMWNDAFNGGDSGAQQLPPEWIKHLMDISRTGMGIQQQPTAAPQPAQKPVQQPAPVAERLSTALIRPRKPIAELSSNKLGQYKKAAGAQASAADKAGNTKKADKRFSGIVKATKKQFANDEKTAEALVKKPQPYNKPRWWEDLPEKERDQFFKSMGRPSKSEPKKKDVAEGVDEGFGSKLAGLGLAGAMALGTSGANARVTPGDDPNINRLTGKPNVTQVAPSDVKPAASAGFNKEWLQKAADPNRTGRYMISVEKAQELLKKMDAVDEAKKKGADGKACWKGYRYAGTENGKDKCVPVGEDVENIMGALIENLIRK